jgi:hypothetical protein
VLGLEEPAEDGLEIDDPRVDSDIVSALLVVTEDLREESGTKLDVGVDEHEDVAERRTNTGVPGGSDTAPRALLDQPP